MIPDAAKLAEDVRKAVHARESARDRQSIEGRLGISDIGFCREYARFVVTQTPASEDPPKWKARIGTAVGDAVEDDVASLFETAERHLEVETTLPSGLKVLGHPDIVTPTGVIDVKSVDGLSKVRRKGPSLQQQFQRQLYGAGLIEQGRTIEWVANLWVDRSGRDHTFHAEVQPYDPVWLSYADEWLSDVIYAVKTGTRTVQDMPLSFCERNCPFYSVCRDPDALQDREGGGPIEDPEAVEWVRIYLEARDDAKEAKMRMDDAKRALTGVSGIADGYVVRWTHVDAVDVAGFTREPYSRMDIRKVPKPR